MRPFLLDVNVLVAMVWPSHLSNRAAQEWFLRNRDAGFRTCPITQAGLVRILSHPRYGRDRTSVDDARSVLAEVLAMPGHEFWADDLPVNDAIERAGSIVGHRQITDAYLLGLAITRNGTLATLDRGVLGLTGAKGNVEIITS